MPKDSVRKDSAGNRFSTQSMPVLTRRQFAVLSLASGLAGCVNLKQLQPNCSIDWAPSLIAPVFYGYEDFGECSGLSCLTAVSRRRSGGASAVSADATRPAMRVFFPSLDGTPSGAAILEMCERFPLVLLVHGECGGNPYYQWDLLPAQLARCGYPVFRPPPSARWSLPRAGEMPGSAARRKAKARSHNWTWSTSTRTGYFWQH